MSDVSYDMVWFWKRRLPERKNEPCTILLRVPQTNSIVVQFADGFMVNTSRWAVRKLNKWRDYGNKTD